MKFMHLHMVCPYLRKTFPIPKSIYCKPLAGTKLLWTTLWQSCELCLNSCYKLLVGARMWSSEIFLERHIHPKLLTLTSGGYLSHLYFVWQAPEVVIQPFKMTGHFHYTSTCLCRISFHKKTGFVVHKLSCCYISYKHICTLQCEIIPVKHSVTTTLPNCESDKTKNVESNKTWMQKLLEVHLNTSWYSKLSSSVKLH